jgi:hypothetical protein
MKFDSEKLRYHLIDRAANAWLAAVLTYGAIKYKEENWREVDDWGARYYSALLRHVEAWRGGEKYDPESTLPHLCHAFFCVMCLLGMDSPDTRDLPERLAHAAKIAREMRAKRGSVEASEVSK